ncbi:MAG: hypothetical protein ACRDD1_04290 [Planctomycetia bacterium]
MSPEFQSDGPEPKSPPGRWGVVEVLGRRIFAGFISEETVADRSFLKVDVPATSDAPPFSKLFSPVALFSLTFTSEADARTTAERVGAIAVDPWYLPSPAPEQVLLGPPAEADAEEVPTLSDEPFTEEHDWYRFKPSDLEVQQGDR